MIVLSVCLPSDALSQHLLFYLGLCFLGCGVSLNGCCNKDHLLLLTLNVGHLLCDDGHSCTIQLPLAAPVLSRSLKLPLMLLFMLLLFCALDFLVDDVLECLTLMDYFKAIINVLKTKF